MRVIYTCVCESEQGFTRTLRDGESYDERVKRKTIRRALFLLLLTAVCSFLRAANVLCFISFYVVCNFLALVTSILRL